MDQGALVSLAGQTQTDLVGPGHLGDLGAQQRFLLWVPTRVRVVLEMNTCKSVLSLIYVCEKPHGSVKGLLSDTVDSPQGQICLEDREVQEDQVHPSLLSDLCSHGHLSHPVRPHTNISLSMYIQYKPMTKNWSLCIK